MGGWAEGCELGTESTCSKKGQSKRYEEEVTLQKLLISGVGLLVSQKIHCDQIADFFGFGLC